MALGNLPGGLRVAPPPVPEAMPRKPPFGGDRELAPMDRLSSARANEGKMAPQLINEAVELLAMAAQRDPNLSAVLAEAMRALNDALDQAMTAPPEEGMGEMPMPPEMPTGGPPTLPV